MLVMTWPELSVPVTMAPPTLVNVAISPAVSVPVSAAGVVDAPALEPEGIAPADVLASGAEGDVLVD